MAKTPEQILANHKEHAERSAEGVARALEAGNAELANFNIGQAFEAYTMQGLIGWRCRLSSPVGPFRDAVHNIRRGLSGLYGMAKDQDGNARNLPLERAAFLEFLVNGNSSAFNTHGLLADRLLDGVLANGINENWDEQKWGAAIAQLQQIKGISRWNPTRRTAACCSHHMI